VIPADGFRPSNERSFTDRVFAPYSKGLIAGGSMALIAMVADRIVQAWAARRKEALGLALVGRSAITIR
jgi:hypothetical protein